MKRVSGRPVLLRLSPALLSAVLLTSACGAAADSAWPHSRSRTGEEFLRVFAPVSRATHDSIVKLNVNGETVALGTVVDKGGLVLSKASELKPGKLTCWLANAQQVPVERLAVDEDEDVALLHVDAPGLKPVQWAQEGVVLGEWAITPGIADTPHAVGIISALPRKINPRRAFLGVQFEPGKLPRVRQLVSGLGAEKAGLKKGDLLLSINDTAVTNREQVADKVGEFREGQTLKLLVQRGEEKLEFNVHLMVPDPQLELDPRDRSTYRVGAEVSQRAEGFDKAIEHDTVLQPWLCGGPLVNLDGKAIGINIARASRVSTYTLPANLVIELLAKLKPVAVRQVSQ